MGQRDMFFMILLYDTGARMDEMLHARICDVKTESPATMLLFGKGKKYRQVSLSTRTVSHYKKYLKKFHPGEDMRIRRNLSSIRSATENTTR